MFSAYTIAIMYATGVVEVMLPVIALYIIYMYKPYKISSIICGLACYFVVDSLIISNIYTIVQTVSDDVLFFDDHIILSLVIQCGITAVLVSPIEYWMISKVRRGNWKLSDTMAMGVGYVMISLLTNGALYVSNARVCQYANQGKLSELANETYTEEVLETLIESVQESYASTTMFSQLAEMFAVVLAQIVILLMAVALPLLLFYGVKRHKKWVIFACMGVDLVFQLIRFGSSYVMGYWPSFVLVVLVGAGVVYFMIRFFKYYRSQQLELIRKQKEFEDRRHQKHVEEMEAKKKLKEQEQDKKNQKAEEEE